MVEQILIGSMVVANGGCYFWGMKDGKSEGESSAGYAPMNLVGVYNLMSLLGVGLLELQKHLSPTPMNSQAWVEKWGTDAMRITDKDIVVGLGWLVGVIIMLLATGIVPQVLYEKGLENGYKKFKKNREEKNE